jgi:uncharacterized protein with PIN domain
VAVQQARLQVADDLRFFLAPRLRESGEVLLSLDGTSTLGHHVEALGIPLPEVGRLLLAGTSFDAGPAVQPAHQPQPGEVIVVEPPARPQALPRQPPAFLLDVHLGTLARRLRLLGLDTAYRNDADDDALVAEGRREERVLLTQDRGLLRRRAVWFGAYVRGARPDDQLDDMLGRFRPPIWPWTRCTACNGVLEPVAKAEVLNRLEPGTRRTQGSFTRCPDCDRVYWPGAHNRRLQETVAAARRCLAST